MRANYVQANIIKQGNRENKKVNRLNSKYPTKSLLKSVRIYKHALAITNKKRAHYMVYT